MDNLIRLTLYLVIGAVLLFANIWYLRALRSLFASSDYVIMPFRIVGKEDPGGALGIALAQMLQARLKNIAENLADAQQQLDPTRPRPPAIPRPQPVARITFAPMISATTITMPTSLLEPANIKLSVAGVEVSGAVAWLQNLLVRQRTLAFTLYSAEPGKMVVAGDAQVLSGKGDGSIWLETAESQEKAISRLAHALLLKHLTSVGGKRMDNLVSVQEFEAFADGLHEAAALSRKIDRGGQVRPEEFAPVADTLAPVALNAAGLPELAYLAADLAERAGKAAKAMQLYAEFKQAATAPGASDAVRVLIADGTVDRKLAALVAAAERTPQHGGAFDYAATLHGSTAHFAVYYETALGSAGAQVAGQVLGKVEADYARLSQLFGDVTLAQPFNVVIAAIGGAQDGTGGAYHMGCDDQTLYVDIKTKPHIDSDRSSFFVVTQAVDVFAAAQGKHADCGTSYGAALKRVLATELYPKEIAEFSTAAYWLDGARADCVSVNDKTDLNTGATGCAVLFLNYLHTQLNIAWERILHAGGATPAETYANLGLGSDAFARFRALIDRHFPPGKPSGLTTDNPFPFADL
jgi:hypothetical protein